VRRPGWANNLSEAEFGMKLEQIAAAVGARLVGQGAVEIARVASLKSATAGSLIFVENEKTLGEALGSAASAIITGEFAIQSDGRKPLLIGRQPRLLFAKAAALLEPPLDTVGGIHPTAVVYDQSGLGPGVSVGMYAIIGPGAVLGAGTRVDSGVVIGEGVQLGERCDIRANVTIYPGTRLGNRVIVHAGAVLGSDGFGYVCDEVSGKYEKFPQVGRLEIGDDVEIGANTTIDRGALDATVIASGVKIDNLVHVGHNVSIGKNVVIAAQTGVSGSSVIENNVVVAGQVGIADHVRIEEGVILGAQSGIPSNKIIRGKGILFWGTPARPIREYLKELAVLARLAKK
jgi:UDP-3-O-[3-hydroxymyristoyl] glucosamine N-acyltransferase